MTPPPPKKNLVFSNCCLSNIIGYTARKKTISESVSIQAGKQKVDLVLQQREFNKRIG